MSAPANIEGGQDPAPHDRIAGWKSIADALGVGEAAARRYANPMRKFRLPVRVNFRGEPYVTRWNLQRFLEDNDMPWGVER